MAASIVINRHTGAVSTNEGTTKTAIDGGSTRVSWSDAPSPGTSDPVPIPTGSANKSWWCSTRLAVGGTGASNGLNTFKWYYDSAATGGPGTGIVFKVQKTTSEVVATHPYVQAKNISSTTTAGTDGLTLNTTNYSSLSGATVDITTVDTVSNAISLNGSYTTNTNVGLANFVVFQMEVSSTASPGTSNGVTFKFQYDET